MPGYFLREKTISCFLERKKLHFFLSGQAVSFTEFQRRIDKREFFIRSELADGKIETNGQLPLAHSLPIANCQLPIAYCPLPLAPYQLPIARQGPPTYPLHTPTYLRRDTLQHPLKIRPCQQLISFPPDVFGNMNPTSSKKLSLLEIK
jgi:hypothetical protein